MHVNVQAQLLDHILAPLQVLHDGCVSRHTFHFMHSVDQAQMQR